MRRIKKRHFFTITITLFVIAFILLVLHHFLYKTVSDTSYTMAEQTVQNPYMGFAPEATSLSETKDSSLVYIEITFKELQPANENEFDFETIDKNNNIDYYRTMGKHAVLRFVCDLPTNTNHSDIPDWLMEKTEGEYYNISYGRGYCPDYNDKEFIKYHKRAVSALAERYDGFVAYVELGSLGHWGEWHIKSDKIGISMPDEAVRNEYVKHYTGSFKTAKLLMRRPFSIADKSGLGLYNDMIGNLEETGQWLDWIMYGGDYNQTGEENAIVKMPDYWETAPSGGEFTGSVPIEKLCTENIDSTIEQLEKSHTTFIGPNVPAEYEVDKKSRNKILSTIGYEIGITNVSISKNLFSGNLKIDLTWENNGIAPLYFKLPVGLYTNNNGSYEKIADVDVDLTKLTPNKQITTTTITEPVDSELYIRISDFTGPSFVTLTTHINNVYGYTRIY